MSWPSQSSMFSSLHLALSFSLHVLTISVFHVLITTSCSVFLSTCPNHISLASLIVLYVCHTWPCSCFFCPDLINPLYSYHPSCTVLSLYLPITLANRTSSKLSFISPVPVIMLLSCWAYCLTWKRMYCGHVLFNSPSGVAFHLGDHPQWQLTWRSVIKYWLVYRNRAVSLWFPLHWNQLYALCATVVSNLSTSSWFNNVFASPKSETNENWLQP